MGHVYFGDGVIFTSALTGGDIDAQIDLTLRDVPADWRRQIRVDIECPSCFATGAELVAAGKSKMNGLVVRQPCFRFRNGDGGDGHHLYCDFFQEENSGRGQSENLVQFGSAKSDVTRAVRELVCRGVQIGVFDQRRMRDMRQWFFETKVGSGFEVTVDPDAIDWAHQVRRFARQASVGFSPLYAEMPGFDWESAAMDRLWQIYGGALEEIWKERLLVHIESVRARAKTLAVRYRGQTVFDPVALRDEYRATRQLCEFICGNYEPVRKTGSKAFHRETRLPQAALMAVSALLFQVSNWKMEIALQKLVAITLEERVRDYGNGNFMGLNPFHDFQAWEVVRGIQASVEPLQLDGYDAVKQFRETVGQLQQEHASWRRMRS